MTKVHEKTTSTLDAEATPNRVPSEEGYSLLVVFGTSPDLKLSFATKDLRDNAAEQIQNSVKRGAQPKGFKVRAREGTYYFCQLLYVHVDTGDTSRKV